MLIFTLSQNIHAGTYPQYQADTYLEVGLTPVHIDSKQYITSLLQLKRRFN